MRRRRRNPAFALSDMTSLAMLAGAAVLLYYLWPTLKGLGSAAASLTSGVKSALNTSTTALANAYVDVTAGPKIQAAGSVVLSTGQEVAISSLTNVQPTTLSDGTASATFSYGGHSWQFTGPADDTGTYYAYMVN